jgi:hypothetical protein
VCGKVFDYLDEDRSGFLDPEEQEKAAQLIRSMMMPKARCEMLDFDSNSDGLIERDEWLDFMRAIARKSSEKDLLDAIKRTWGGRMEDNSATNSRLANDSGEAISIGILPTTKWDQIKPQCSYLDELKSNPNIRTSCPDIDAIAEDVRLKAEEFTYVAETKSLVELLRDPSTDRDDCLHAIIAYTHDLSSGSKDGNLYYEKNKMLRDRSAAGRGQMMSTWGVCVHYMLKGLARLPDFSGVCYRGFPSSDKEDIESRYREGREIQWGAFSSTTTDVAAARYFAGLGGVVAKIKLLSGKDICKISFFETEKEIISLPNDKFLVTRGCYSEGCICMVDLHQNSGAEIFKS